MAPAITVSGRSSIRAGVRSVLKPATSIQAGRGDAGLRRGGRGVDIVASTNGTSRAYPGGLRRPRPWLPESRRWTGGQTPAAHPSCIPLDARPTENTVLGEDDREHEPTIEVRGCGAAAG